MEQHIGRGSCNSITIDAAKPICHHVADVCHVKSSTTMGQPQGKSGRGHFASRTSAKSKINAFGGSDLKTFVLPDAQRHNDNELTNEILRETNNNMEELAEYIQKNEPRLIPHQREAFNKII